MKTKRAVLLLLVASAVAVAGCRERTDRSEGTVLLTVSNFDGLPLVVSLASGDFQIDSVTIQNIVKDPTGTSSELMNVELRAYEMTYRRRDTGTRVPPAFTNAIFGHVPVGGSETILGLPFLTSHQLSVQPLKDLVDFGIDRETGTAVVVLDVTMKFFGRTLSGDEIVSEPASFTIEVRR